MIMDDLKRNTELRSWILLGGFFFSLFSGDTIWLSPTCLRSKHREIHVSFIPLQLWKPLETSAKAWFLQERLQNIDAASESRERSGTLENPRVSKKRIASLENSRPGLASKTLDDPFITPPETKTTHPPTQEYILKSIDSQDVILLKACSPSPTSARTTVLLDQQSIEFCKSLRRPATKTSIEQSSDRNWAATLPKSFFSGTTLKPSIRIVAGTSKETKSRQLRSSTSLNKLNSYLSPKDKLIQPLMPKSIKSSSNSNTIPDRKKSPSKSPIAQVTKPRGPVLLTQLRAQRHKPAVEDITMASSRIEREEEDSLSKYSRDTSGGISIQEDYQTSPSSSPIVSRETASTISKTGVEDFNSGVLITGSHEKSPRNSMDRVSSISSSFDDSDIIIVTENPHEPFKPCRYSSSTSTATNQTIKAIPIAPNGCFHNVQVNPESISIIDKSTEHKPRQSSHLIKEHNVPICIQKAIPENDLKMSAPKPSTENDPTSQKTSRTFSKSYAEVLQGPKPNDQSDKRKASTANTAIITTTPTSQCSNSHSQSTPGGVMLELTTPIREETCLATTSSPISGGNSTNSSLRATAAAFVPESSKSTSSPTWIQLAEQGIQHMGPPQVEFLEPWSVHKDDTLGLRDGTVYYEVDQNIYQNAFGDNYAMTNFDLPQSANYDWEKRVPWCKVVPRLYVDDNVLGTVDYKVQIPQTKEENFIPGPPGLVESPSLSPHELKKRQELLNTNILQHEILEQSRTLTSLATKGPAKYPHTMPSLQALTENMWMKPIGPGHPYTDFKILPHVRSKEWHDISIAIKLLNKEYANRETKFYWEPEIPTGFSARALHNQPGRMMPISSNPIGLRGGSGGEDEWNWVASIVKGCDYCGNPSHSQLNCPIWKTDLIEDEEDDNEDKESDARNDHVKDKVKSVSKVRCLNCGSNTHVLRCCRQSPKFNDEFPRFKKLQFYAHTEHWRKALHLQHIRFVTHKGFVIGRDFPAKLKDGIGDAALVFSWFPCAACAPETHWNEIQDTMEFVKCLCKHQMLGGKQTWDERCNGHKLMKTNKFKPPFYEVPNWVIEYGFCPVVWTVMHQEVTDRAWAVLNPMNSIAVDAFWRIAMKAMGWDVPDMLENSDC